MTLLVVIVLGAGTLLIISAMENTPLVQTFRDVLAGKPVSIQQASSGGSTSNKGSSGGSSDSGNPITGTSSNFD